MRRSFYTLSGMVTDLMGGNIQDGDVYIFVNRPRTGMKILHMEFGGLVVYHMRLGPGCFKLPVFDLATNTFQTSWQDLMVMVQGVGSNDKMDKKRRKNLKKTEEVFLQQILLDRDRLFRESSRLACRP